MSSEQKNEIEKLKEVFLEEIKLIQSQEYLKNLRDKYLSGKECGWK